MKEPLTLIVKISQYRNDSGFSPYLSKWFFTICSTSYNHNYNVLRALKYNILLGCLIKLNDYLQNITLSEGSSLL